MTRRDRLRKLILATASDAASNVAYYGRKEDKSLSREDYEEAIEKGYVTTAEIAAEFLKGLGE